MKFLSYTVPAKLLNNAKTMFMCMLLDCKTNISQGIAWLDLVYSQPHRLIGNFAQSFGLYRWFANVKHTTSITVIPIFDDGDIDI